MTSFTRRSFLSGALGTGIVGGTVAASRRTNPGRGVVRKPNGAPLSGGTLLILDPADQFAVLEKVSIASDGSFTTNKSQYSTIALLLKGDGDQPWFDIVGGNGADWNVGDYEVSRQLLYGPTLGRDSTGVALSVASIWRTVFSDAGYQVINVGITNTDSSGNRPAYDVGFNPYDLNSGFFNLSFKEDAVLVESPGATSVDFSEAVPEVWIAPTPATLSTPLERLHPLHPESYELPLGPHSDIADFTYKKVSSQHSRDVAKSALGRVANNVPLLSSAIAWANTIDWLLEITGNYNRSTVLGNLGASQLPNIDPNKMETVTLGWHGENDTSLAPGLNAATAVFSAPIKLAGTDPQRLLVQAGWKKPREGGPDDASGILVHELAVPPAGGTPVVGSNLPGNADDDAALEDVDGDGDVDEQDVRALAKHLDDPAVTAHPDKFDFNGNGRVDYDDVVELSEEASEE